MMTDSTPTRAGYVLVPRSALISTSIADHSTGAWVRWADYQAIASEYARLKQERDDLTGIVAEFRRHAKNEGMSYREDEFGAPYLVNVRAEARIKEADDALRPFAEGSIDGRQWVGVPQTILSLVTIRLNLGLPT